jgi:phage FluMu protein Com
MEANNAAASGAWLKVLCPTCLSEEERASLSAHGELEKEKFGAWLKSLCPTCLN